TLKGLAQERLVVPRAAGIFSRLAGLLPSETDGATEISVPFGTPRFVNVATLKRMLKAKSSDVLLKRVGEQWEICENSHRVDLRDGSIEFRLGAIQIYS